MPPSLDGPASGRRVLIIEDNADAAHMLSVIIDMWGYQVTIADTGTDGVAQALALRPDVVICDIGLPGMNGYDVARTLRADPSTRHAKLIAVTGYGQDSDRKLALEAGFDLHLPKPVQPDFLRTKLEE